MRRSLVVLFLVCGLASVLSCGKSPTTAVVPDQAPQADSPYGAAQRLLWSYDHQDFERYRRLFTADYRFLFFEYDASGTAYRQVPWTREDELIAAKELFDGSATIRHVEDGVRGLADLRPGKNRRWHQVVEIPIRVLVRLDDGSTYFIRGTDLFACTRGDSAEIPVELGVPPDSTTWYVDTWYETYFTMWGNAARRVDADTASPGLVTWGFLKVLFRKLTP